MSTEGKCIPAKQLASLPSSLTNARSDRNLRKKLKKFKTGKTVLSLAVRKSPEITVSLLSGKKKMKELPKSVSSVKMKEKTIWTTTMESKLQKVQQNHENFACKKGPPDNNLDVFSFTPTDGKEKSTQQSDVKQNVLRTIYRMLQENRILRKRELILSQNPGPTDQKSLLSKPRATVARKNYLKITGRNLERNQTTKKIFNSL
ncbi:uncharacterized protein si:ch211-277c7.7 isoform X3 [Trichomycterus rosablanca]|uniref:uncharacterized protein si:ch211-277c7.7 isoform X3 n=1 Tax=Trichomycterus rosablanca TaxID=2290929 RepID=UPI002F34FBC8